MARRHQVVKEKFRISNFGPEAIFTGNPTPAFQTAQFKSKTNTFEIRNPKSLPKFSSHEQSRYQFRSSPNPKLDENMAQMKLHSLFRNP
jgi:hypothetical protein